MGPFRHIRMIRHMETFTFDEEQAGHVRRVIPRRHRHPPPENIRGEPWGWTKGPPYPVDYDRFTDPAGFPPGYREDGDDGPG